MHNVTRKETFSPVYLFRGDQELLIKRELDNLALSYLKQRNDFNYLLLDADNTTPTEIVEHANTKPMFDERKLVVVKNADRLSAKKLGAIQEYIDSPSHNTCLVLVSGELRKPPLRKSRNLAILTFQLKDDIRQKIKEESEIIGLDLTPAAVNLIHDLLGNDLTLISNELIKLSQFYKDKVGIDEEEVNGFISRRNYSNVFELINALCARDKKRALSVLSELEHQGLDPLAVLSTILWKFNQLVHAKQLMKEKVSKRDIPGIMGISAGAFYYLSRQTELFSFADLKNIIGIINDADVKLKSVSRVGYEIVTGLVLEICNTSG